MAGQFRRAGRPGRRPSPLRKLVCLSDKPTVETITETQTWYSLGDELNSGWELGLVLLILSTHLPVVIVALECWWCWCMCPYTVNRSKSDQLFPNGLHLSSGSNLVPEWSSFSQYLVCMLVSLLQCWYLGCVVCAIRKSWWSWGKMFLASTFIGR